MKRNIVSKLSVLLLGILIANTLSACSINISLNKDNMKNEKQNEGSKATEDVKAKKDDKINSSDIKNSKNDKIVKENKNDNNSPEGKQTNDNINNKKMEINAIAKKLCALDMGSSGASLKKIIIFKDLVDNADLLILNENIAKKEILNEYNRLNNKNNYKDTIEAIKKTAYEYLNNYDDFDESAEEAGVHLDENKVSKAQLNEILNIISFVTEKNKNK